MRTDFDAFAVIVTTLVVVGVVGGLGILILDKLNSQVAEQHAVTDEQHAAGAVPFLITVSNTPVKENSETLVAVNTSTGATATLVRGTNYTVVSYQNGEFNITAFDTANYDAVNASYTYLVYLPAIEQTTGAIGDLFGWLGIIVIVIVAVVILGYLRSMQNSGR